jgi:hypothetical protein
MSFSRTSMSFSETPCLSLAIARLTAAEAGHYAIWVTQSPYPGGYVHHDCLWISALTQAWENWQGFFSLRGLPMVPHIPVAYVAEISPDLMADDPSEPPGQAMGYSSRLMQHLGVSLWQWLFDGSIQNSFNQSRGIAMGQSKPLRIRLEIRDPELIALPWEIMQPQPGKQAISLSQQLLFSRTTSDVDPLPPLRVDQALKILLVLGHDAEAPPISGQPIPVDPAQNHLQLQQEAKILAEILSHAADKSNGREVTPVVACKVDTLLQPTPEELIQQLESGDYNVFFYSGHGVPAPDGGLLFVRADATLNGTELAQVLVRCQVKLAVFNACWGAQPDQQNQEAIPRSSLAEVLIHHGVPAVLGMRDSIADNEALSFIQAFARALSARSPIDEAVAIARQQLLTIYKFNQPAWTLPVLYMHPEFNGELIKPLAEGVTEIPESSISLVGQRSPTACLRVLNGTDRQWPIQGGIMRVGSMEGNDLVLKEPGVSRKHAEIFYRDSLRTPGSEPCYFLRDFSRFGTLVLMPDGWQRVHHQEIALQPKTQLKFGSSRSQPLEFLVDG